MTNAIISDHPIWFYTFAAIFVAAVCFVIWIISKPTAKELNKDEPGGFPPSVGWSTKREAESGPINELDPFILSALADQYVREIKQ